MLLGIDITIIALATAAAADTYPEEESAPSVLHLDRFPGWQYAPAPMKEGAEVMYETYGVRPQSAPFWALEHAMDNMEDIGLRPARAWSPKHRYDDAAFERHPSVTFRHHPHRRARAARSTTSPVHARAAVMPKLRLPMAQRRAQVDLARVTPRLAAVHMSHATAAGWLRSAGLRTTSTGNCVSRHMHHCTSLDSVRTGTITRVIQLKRASGCPIMVTGGTEAGHAPGQFSHGNGYKLDIGHNACIDRHIRKNHDRIGTRGDGSPLYRSASGTTFADESDHWDILFR
ncbi:hypothetical protein [Nonomuraea jiangxiensis]|uniref:hypothetical protein n=1 Tax=Nonomuraea jiangxiensis TaxID=633440 RepID=UPI000B864897|nr:hypothetical protein [Nonomuraea jiangxiensis]